MECHDSRLSNKLGKGVFYYFLKKRTPETFYTLILRFYVYLEANSSLFIRQLDFSSEPAVANESLENEPKSWLAVALVLNLIYTRFSEN